MMHFHIRKKEDFQFASNLPKNGPNHYPELYQSKEKMLRIVFQHIFGVDCSQREKLSVIKQPLL